MGASGLEPGLLQDAVVRARCEIIARFARDCDAAGLRCVLELAMAAAGCHEHPTPSAFSRRSTSLTFTARAYRLAQGVGIEVQCAQQIRVRWPIRWFPI